MQFMNNLVFSLLMAIFAIQLKADFADAKEFSSNRVVFWDVYAPDDDELCWLVSLPLENRSIHTRDNRLVSVSRGGTDDEIIAAMFIVLSRKPDANRNPYIAFTGGTYRFSDDLENAKDFWILVDKTIGPFQLTVNGESNSSDNRGWAFSLPNADNSIINAFKKGGEVEVSSVSARGTISKDYFSLIGFTSAFDDMRKRCS